MKISVVIPIYNEVDSLEQLYNELSEVLSVYNFYQIIFVDDGSSDGSVDFIRKIIDNDINTKIIQFHRNYGKSAALAEGFKNADGEYIVTMDADLQDDPAEIPNLILKLE